MPIASMKDNLFLDLLGKESQGLAKPKPENKHGLQEN